MSVKLQNYLLTLFIKLAISNAVSILSGNGISPEFEDGTENELLPMPYTPDTVGQFSKWS